MAKVEEKKASNIKVPAGEYFYAVGRRKRAVATVRLYKGGNGEIEVNGRDFNEYFPTVALNTNVVAPLKQAGMDDYTITVKVAGGGISGQSDAVRHGISRALVKMDEELRTTLKRCGYLKRDSRVKERKKPGLKRARRAPQWSKR
jgi:small subunit ribosomal protein S9